MTLCVCACTLNQLHYFCITVYSCIVPLFLLYNKCEYFFLSQNIQYREDCPDKCPKVKTLGVWSSNHCKLEEAVKLAVALEEARLVTS